MLLGEHDLGVDETRDCVRKRVASCPSTPQKRVAEDIVVHELWNRQNYSLGNDVALVRLDRPVITFVVGQQISITVSLHHFISKKKNCFALLPPPLG